MTVCDPPEDWWGALWLDIAGLPRAEELGRLRDRFGLHPLALEDVATGAQRPKFDEFGSVLFLILSRPHWDSDELRLEQVSLFLGERFVVSIHEAGDDLFEPVRRRLAEGGTSLLDGGGERLLHPLADLVVDQGFPVLDVELQVKQAGLEMRTQTERLDASSCVLASSSIPPASIKRYAHHQRSRSGGLVAFAMGLRNDLVADDVEHGTTGETQDNGQ